MKPYLSYSEIDLWKRSKTEYVQRYVEGKEIAPNLKMQIGTIVHRTIEEPRYPYLKELRELTLPADQIYQIRKILTKVTSKRAPMVEQTIVGKTGQGEGILAVYDGFDKTNHILYEYKTGDREEAWTQYRVDTNLQLSFYAYIYHQVFHRYFREILLFYLNTNKGTCQTFRTARGYRDLEFIEEIVNKTIQEMKAAGIWEKRLTREERIKLQNLELPVDKNN